MRGVSDIKGLADMRTAISSHYRNVSRTKATPYLDILSLGMQRLRMEHETERLDRRKERVRRRLAEVRDHLEKRIQQVRGSDPPGPEVPGSAVQPPPTGSRRPTMQVHY